MLRIFGFRRSDLICHFVILFAASAASLFLWKPSAIHLEGCLDMTLAPARAPAQTLLRFQHLNKGFLRNIDASDALHPLFSFLLFFQQLALSRNITAVTFCRHVFAQRRNAFTRDDFTADRSLNRDLIKLARNYFFKLRCQLSSPTLSAIFVHNGG